LKPQRHGIIAALLGRHHARIEHTEFLDEIFFLAFAKRFNPKSPLKWL
jgi:hypothetical protein